MYNVSVNLLSNQIASGVYAQEDKQQYSKAPQRGASIAKEWQRNTNHRRQSKHHTHIDKHMEQEDT